MQLISLYFFNYKKAIVPSTPNSPGSSVETMGNPNKEQKSVPPVTLTCTCTCTATDERDADREKLSYQRQTGWQMAWLHKELMRRIIGTT